MTGAAAASYWSTLRTRQQSMSTASSPGTAPKADAAKNPPIHTDQPIAGQNAATPDAAAADAQLQRVWTVPNALSFARLVSSPVILVCFAGSQYHAAAGLFVFGAVSDLLDGMIARAFPSQRSMLGTALDPLADKFFMICSAAALAWVGSMPLPLATLVIARDVSLITGASYYRWKTTERPRTWTKLLDITQVATEFIPTRISKLNTAVQFITIFCAVLTFTPYSIVSATTLDWMWWTMAFTTFASGLSYVGNNNAVKLLKIPRRS
ncbi:hypothetical protein CAOG_02651 [Capsaspora owczarzaki ATCC 30864]|uniref:hypothetical protein n=1 Tax=Capsaspora owczarzaki (strain ATCC 30864) TaxID=595528 RepID=UPI00035261C9|nr:hypothetical protein CAOG_02651 [Capsaspora owczarzaki ATCC 30864]|eukprot:XP_004349401.2 hypothetical protein CAOG_02651 [Capsaspora owczarzaki ATCC 30864]